MLRSSAYWDQLARQTRTYDARRTPTYNFESHIPSTKILSYIAISLAGLLAGSVAGGLGGLLLGWFLALGYHRHGPSDPGDAPVHVALGLMLVGAGLGAIVGLVVGIIYSVRLTRRANAQYELYR
jgi:membrane associated rhomboid family serine protease